MIIKISFIIYLVCCISTYLSKLLIFSVHYLGPPFPHADCWSVQRSSTARTAPGTRQRRTTAQCVI